MRLIKFHTNVVPLNRYPIDSNTENLFERVRIEADKRYYIVSDDIIFLRSPTTQDVISRTGIVSNDIIFMRFQPGESLSFVPEDVEISDHFNYVKVIEERSAGETTAGMNESIEGVSSGTENTSDPIPLPPINPVPKADMEVNLNDNIVILDTKQLLIFGTNQDGEGNVSKTIWCLLIPELNRIEMSSDDKILKVYLRKEE